MTFYERVQAAVETLAEAGLYARGSSPIDWEQAKRDGRTPILIAGGRSKDEDDPHGVNLTREPFQIETADTEYLVRTPGKEERFKSFDSALAHVLMVYQSKT